MSSYIELKNVRVNNLKNISLKIPHNKFIVITGVSGSGKSSLAFDTLYAEGQRRYVESLSSYARQFLGRMNKPDFDYIKGLPPAIAVEQKVNTRNPRSTVGTSTEIYDYLRMLYARIGHTYSPISGNEVKKHSSEDVLNCIMPFSKGTKFVILAKLHVNEQYTTERQLQIYLQQGFSRIYHNHDFCRIEDILDSKQEINKDNTYLLIDRLSVNEDSDTISRINDSLETAFLKVKAHADWCFSHQIFHMIFQTSLRLTACTSKNQMTICSLLILHLVHVLCVKDLEVLSVSMKNLLYQIRH